MALPTELQKIKQSLELRKGTKTLSEEEQVLLSELTQLDRRISSQVLNEIRSSVTRMTGPGGNVCGCCGRPY
jgi:hypothetical protein